MSAIIEVKNVSKSFKLPHERVDSLREGLTSFISRKKTYDTFDALKNVSFKVEKGDFVGIIGRNGCGKSTLLKIIAGIYTPDSGEVIVKEAISPFLELGVGFNPELTARENVYLNGIVLGLSHKQVEEKYDEIVAFAGLEKFMDSKLKNFSSGMQVRLAFSVAIQSPAPILLIDEVLAVGDAEFQEKCFSIFRQLKEQGKTIIFVSHSLDSIKKFCNKTILVENGKITDSGNTLHVINTYSRLSSESIEASDTNLTEKQKERWGDGNALVKAVNIFDSRGKNVKIVEQNEAVTIELSVLIVRHCLNPVFGISIRNETMNDVFVTNTAWFDPKPTGSFNAGEKVKVKINFNNLLVDGRYFVSPAIAKQDMITFHDWRENYMSFSVNSPFSKSGEVTLEHTIKIERPNGH